MNCTQQYLRYKAERIAYGFTYLKYREWVKLWCYSDQRVQTGELKP